MKFSQDLPNRSARAWTGLSRRSAQREGLPRRSAEREGGRAKITRKSLIQPVLQRLGHVAAVDPERPSEIGNRAADTQHAIATARAEAEFVNRRLEQLRRFAIERAVRAQRGALHRGIQLRRGAEPAAL